MSVFDKYVAQWVSRAGDDLSKEAREQLLTNIHDSLSDYESLRDPKAARARKEDVEKGKQREEERKKKEEAARTHEEQTRKRQERQANLPPLPPSKSNAERRGDATAAGAAAGCSVSGSDAGKPKKKKVGAKKSSTTAAAAASEQDTAVAANTLNATSSRKSRTSPKIPYSKEGVARTAKRGQGWSAQVRDIDFKFGERVDSQLRSIEAEKTPKNAAGGSAGKKVKLFREVDAVNPEPPSPPTTPAAAAPVAVSTEGTDAAAAAALAQNSACKRSSPPPLDQMIEEAEKHQEAVEKKQQQQEEGEQAALVATGHYPPTSHEDGLEEDDNSVAESSSNDEESVASFGETKNYQERINAFHFASVGDDHDGTEEDRSDVMDEEEEYIDDREDVRRRTIQMQRPSRPAISDSTLDIDEARIANFPTTPKSQNKVKTISRVLVRHFLFSTLDDSDIARFASTMDLEKFNAGEKILTKGELNDTFYIILDGEAETTEVNEAGAVVTVPLVCGSTCGDLALMYEVKSEADVTTRTAVQCASIERRTYKMITSRAMEDKRTRYIDFLAAMPLFTGLSPYELERVAEMLKEDTYEAGQRVITYGVPNHWLHIVVDGTLRVVCADEEDGKEREVAVITRGQLAGEVEFVYHRLPFVSVYAESAVVKTAKLSRRSFELTPSEVRERLVRLVEDDAHYASYRSRLHSASPPALDATPHFDAPPASVQKSLRQYENDQSDGTPAMSATPPPQPSE